MPTATASRPHHHHHPPKQSPPTGSPSRSGMVPTQLSYLANEARTKLYRGVLHADDYDLRVLVGHANLLDCLTRELLAMELDTAAREEEPVPEGLLPPPSLPSSGSDKKTVKAQDVHLKKKKKKKESHHAPAISVSVRELPPAEADEPSLRSLPALRPVPSRPNPWR